VGLCKRGIIRWDLPSKSVNYLHFRRANRANLVPRPIAWPVHYQRRCLSFNLAITSCISGNYGKLWEIMGNYGKLWEIMGVIGVLPGNKHA
jgi:hypothetical protein